MELTANSTHLNRYGPVLCVTALTLIGLWLRLRHLGHLGFIVDEGFQALAVQAILSHDGVPRLTSGYVYLRSPLFLYIQAAFAYLWGVNEWTLRLPAALFGAACIPAGYLLGKVLYSRWIGVIVALLLALSAWEIDLSRYARFYTLFQFMYILALAAFVQGFLRKQSWAKIAFFILALTAIVCHALGVMLAGCFLAFVLYPGLAWLRRAGYAVGACAVVLMWAAYQQVFNHIVAYLTSQSDAIVHTAVSTVPVRPMTSNHALNAVLAVIPSFKLPVMRWFYQLWDQHPALIAAAAVVPLASSIAVALRMSKRGQRWPGLFALGMIWAGYTGQAALVVTLLVLYLVLFIRRREQLRSSMLLIGFGGACLCLAGYVAWFIVNPSIPTRYGIGWMWRFPDYYTYLLQWFGSGWPVIFVLVILAAIYLAFRMSDSDQRKASWFVLGSVFVPLLLTSLLQWQFSQSRYFFHLYPLMLLMVACLVVAAVRWSYGQISKWNVIHVRARGMVVAIPLIVLCVATRDMNPVRAYEIGNQQPTTHQDPIRSVLNWKFYGWFHQDLRSAALYVRARLKPGERVLVVGPPHDAAVYRYYVGRVDYVLTRPKEYTNTWRLRDGSLFDPVSGGRIIRTSAQINAVARASQAGGLWILSDKIMVEPQNWFLTDKAREALARLTAHPDYVAHDRETIAVKIK